MLVSMLEKRGIKRLIDVNAGSIYECVSAKRDEGAVDAQKTGN